VLEPLDLMARLAALVPPAGRGRGKKPQAEEDADKPVTDSQEAGADLGLGPLQVL
jgi:hypothetical protein